ncbi:MAG TPA: hypothetical protein VMB76_17635 [Casimicrobiaceae bacterium]|jgi:hypothetical protein|nr:hypothetical protein [Casimicrobiaceae bacterium]
MLQPAHVGHLAVLRALIREGAAEGSFDRGLAADSTEATDFFEKLKRALVTGYFVEQDARTGRIDTVAVPGYVFWPDDRHSGMPPVGFGLFRALDHGYELWLAGLEFARRGGGQGRALLDALFSTAPGQKTYVVRVQRASRYLPQVTHLMQTMRFTSVGDTARLRWFVRDDAPPALAARIREAVSARRPVN